MAGASKGGNRLREGGRQEWLAAQPRQLSPCRCMPRPAPLDALVWRRTDFRESSRVVTLLSRAHGKVRAFAKGAHRHDSVLLGKIDFLNLLEVDLWRRGETMPLLSRARLLHEPRRLRQPTRFLLAAHLVEIVDVALPDDRADPTLFDLVQGGILLLERSPTPALAVIACGLEWRFLAALGARPDPDVCAATGAALPRRATVALAPGGRGFELGDSARPGAMSVPAGARDFLRTLGDTPGKRWPELRVAPAAIAAAAAALGTMVAHAIERRPPGRAAALRPVLAAHAAEGRVPARDDPAARER